MRDLYPALARRIFKDYDSSHEADAILYGLIRSIGVHLDRWRLAHVALPRNNLGGAGTNTRSLAGASDSLTTVTGMRVRARTNDPLRPVGDSSPATDWSSDAFPMRLWSTSLHVLGPNRHRISSPTCKRGAEYTPTRRISERHGLASIFATAVRSCRRVNQPSTSSWLNRVRRRFTVFDVLLLLLGAVLGYAGNALYGDLYLNAIGLIIIAVFLILAVLVIDRF